MLLVEGVEPVCELTLQMMKFFKSVSQVLSDINELSYDSFNC